MLSSKVRTVDEALKSRPQSVVGISDEDNYQPSAKAQAMTMESHEREFTPRSMTAATARAIKIARQWQEIPDDWTDEQAFSAGLITPDQIILIISLFQELFSCLSNRPASAMARIRAYNNAGGELNRVADTVRFNWLIDRWMMRLNYPRDRGDVNELRAAFMADSENMDEEQFANVQRELLFLTI